MEYEKKITKDGLYYIVGEYGQTDCYIKQEDAIIAYILLSKEYNEDNEYDDDYYCGYERDIDEVHNDDII
jgi:hypothetical protein